jgi:C1A family cysteine protease
MFKFSGAKGFGWLPDYPDFRDYTNESTELSLTHQKLGLKRPVKEILKDMQPKTTDIPSKRDLRNWCSPVEDQKSLGSCTAQAAVGALEYFERRVYKKHIDASRLFLYKVSRNLLGWSGDTGAYNRTTMGALALFGVPPELYWPYIIEKFDDEPPAFCYVFAQSYQALMYYRIDPPGSSGDKVLDSARRIMALANPFIFGFSVYSCIEQANENGKVPYPTSGDSFLGGHAVLAVGYDDEMKIKHADSGDETTGAILFKNSWGTEWGEEGYGWLPYKYVENGLSRDWWSLTKAEWVDLDVFGLRDK